jgi:dihydrolipoamide dehydrogenase
MGEQTLETQVAVIGGGVGGYTAAFRAADLGLEVALINQEERLGGVCLLRGCIPSKTLLEVTQLIHEAREARDWGVDFGEPEINLEGLRSWKEQVSSRLVRGLDTLADRREVQLIQARAVFEDPDRLRLQGADLAHVQFEHAVIATGSIPIALPGTEFKPDARVMDAAAALELPDIPERLLVVGAGYVGMELGSVYATLGSRVTVVEMLDGLLPNVDRDLVRPLARRAERVFEAIYLNTKVAHLDERDDEVVVTLEGELDEPEQTFDRVLVAVGRRANSHHLGLEHTGVEVDDQGLVKVDEQMRTADERIFAVGDVVGEPMLAHKAMHEGKIAAEVIAGQAAAFDVRCIPAVVYTDPEIAWCGLSVEEAEAQGREVGIGRFPWGASGRARTMGEAEGLTKMVFESETGRVVGIGIVGQGAEGMISEGALAIEMGAVAQDLALTVHPHPTLSETESEAAEAFLGLSTHILSRRSSRR